MHQGYQSPRPASQKLMVNLRACCVCEQAAGGQGGFAAALHGDGGVGPSNMGGEGMQWHTPDQMGTPQDGMGRGGSEMALVIT